jgi:hypothetical protein
LALSIAIHLADANVQSSQARFVQASCIQAHIQAHRPNRDNHWQRVRDLNPAAMAPAMKRTVRHEYRTVRQYLLFLVIAS